MLESQALRVSRLEVWISRKVERVRIPEALIWGENTVVDTGSRMGCLPVMQASHGDKLALSNGANEWQLQANFLSITVLRQIKMRFFSLYTLWHDSLSVYICYTSMTLLQPQLKIPPRYTTMLLLYGATLNQHMYAVMIMSITIECDTDWMQPLLLKVLSLWYEPLERLFTSCGIHLLPKDKSSHPTSTVPSDTITRLAIMINGSDLQEDPTIEECTRSSHRIPLPTHMLAMYWLSDKYPIQTSL